ncbi:MAG TPA: winged helix-turn-helix domain-containing protein [Rudaea sp.]|nr:winged helix-turn-helix domain-containing protein [Rudaea sp.]
MGPATVAANVVFASRHSVGACTVDLGTHRIFRGEAEVRISPKATAVLARLLETPGQAVSRETLLLDVWNSAHASDELLTQAVKELRRAFRDDPRAPAYIETIPKGGYRLLAAVAPQPAAAVVLTNLDDAPTASNEVAAGTVEAPATPVRRYGRFTPLALVAFAAVVVGAGLAAQKFAPRAPAPAAVPIQVEAITSGYEDVTFPSISADGALVAYAARKPQEGTTHIFVQTASGSAPLPIDPGASGSDTYPVWSPDGKSIAFMRYDADTCTFRVTAATGGPSRPVANCTSGSIMYFDWTPDGERLVTQWMENDERHLRLRTIRISDGSYASIDYAFDENLDDLSPHYAPDGASIAFRRGQNPYSDLFLIPARGGAARQLTHLRTTISGFAWLPDSRHVVFSSKHGGRSRLYLLDVASGAIVPTNQENVEFPSVGARSGRLTAARGHSTVNLSEYLLDASASGPSQSFRAPSSAQDLWPAYSHSGGRLCFVSDRSGSSQLWLSDPASETPLMLTHLDGDEIVSNPHWTPDDGHIVFVAQQGARSRLYAVDVDSHQLEQISAASENVRAAGFAPDTGALTWVSDRGGRWQLWERRPEAGGDELLLDLPVLAFDFGPGNTIYYTEDHRQGLFRLEAGGHTELVTREVNTASRRGWQVGEAGIYFVTFLDDEHSNLRFLRWSDKDASVVRPLENYGADMSIAVVPDGSRVTVPVYSHLESVVVVSETGIAAP